MSRYALPLAVLIGAGVLVASNLDWAQLQGLSVPSGNNQQPTSADTILPPDAATPLKQRQSQTIRMATFNIQVFGQKKVSDGFVMDHLGHICSLFDVVAIQEIRSIEQDVMPRLVQEINTTWGRQYNFVISERLGDTDSKEQYAFVYDTASIEVDRTSVYTINDPENVLHREPLVAGFRVRGPVPEQAFTFTLVNIHTDPDVAQSEVAVMDDVFRAVRNDGRGEDDIILLGDFNLSGMEYSEITRLRGMVSVITNSPTNVRLSASYDNIIFDRDATTEATGRGGVLNFPQNYKLSEEEALRISDHMPVWAEFTVIEGGRPGYVATAPNHQPR